MGWYRPVAEDQPRSLPAAGLSSNSAADDVVKDLIDFMSSRKAAR